MVTVTQIDDGLDCIDLGFQGQLGVIAVYLLEDHGERALIEIGPSSTLDNLLSALNEVDVDPASISKILLTHIHLDHAGASGTWMNRFKNAQLYVHESGAPHMIDPSRLLSSATRIYGDRMEPLWGRVDPVAAARVHNLHDGDTVAVGTRQLAVLHTPGHASHHVIFYDEVRGSVFAGDVAAVRMQGIRYIRPPTPPPDIDLAAWQHSLDRIAGLQVGALYIAHFGAFTDVEWHLKQARSSLLAWEGIVKRAHQSGQDRTEIIDTLRLHADHDLLQVAHRTAPLHQYELATPFDMSVDGYLRYLRGQAKTSS